VLTKEEIEEFNKFLDESPLRNGFMPILHHIQLLKPNQFNIEEYKDLNNKTSSIIGFVSTDQYKDEERIRIQIHYDKTPECEGQIIYEMWWSDENYCLSSPIPSRPEIQINRVKNMLTMIIQNIDFKKFTDMKDYRRAQRGEYLLPILKI